MGNWTGRNLEPRDNRLFHCDTGFFFWYPFSSSIFCSKWLLALFFYCQYIFLIKLQSLYFIHYIVKTRFMWTLSYRTHWIVCNSKRLNMLFLVCKQFKQPFKLQILKTGFSNDRKFSWTLIWESVLDNGRRRNTVVLDSLSQVNLTRDQVHPPTIILSFRNAT